MRTIGQHAAPLRTVTIDGEWYEIRFGRDERAKLYGVRLIYAAAKRQLSHREKKSYGLL